MDQNELSHYGVPGMRWGVRRSGASSTSSRIKKGPPSDDYKRMQDMRKRGTKNLTTAELKELTGRMQLEKQYKDLSKVSISAGRKYTTDIMKEIGKETIKGAIKKGTVTKGIVSSVKYVADFMTTAGQAY